MQLNGIILDKYLETIKKTPLFEGIENISLGNVLRCLDPMYKCYDKGASIIRQGDKFDKLGIVVNGHAQIVKEDINGNRVIMTELSEADMFGEAIALAAINSSPVAVYAVSECSAIFISIKKIIANCSSACVYHLKLIENLFKILAAKNIMLNQKIDIISKRTMREKLLAYFEVESKKHNSNNFRIPFTREELADFLGVNRSAMSRELSNMREEGLIDFYKNTIKINSIKGEL